MKVFFIAYEKKGTAVQNLMLTPLNQARLNEAMKKHPNKRWKISLDEDITDNMRKFFEGAVVPYFALQHSIKGMPMSIETAREALKLEFNPAYVKDVRGEAKVIPGTTTKLNKEKFREFVEKCLEYMERNGYEVPDSESYNDWYNHAPAPGAVYPPLKRLLDLYNKNKE